MATPIVHVYSAGNGVFGITQSRALQRMNRFTLLKTIFPSFASNGLLMIICLGLVQPVWAQGQHEQVRWPRMQELTWMDQNHMARQRQFVDDLGNSELGRPVRGNKSDLQLLQRIIDAGLIRPTEAQNLQALGAVLGDVYVQEFDILEWRVYEDQKGRSRAVCVRNTSNCLFPVTMLSRRIEAGLKPNVDEVYQKGVAQIKPYLPKLPFSAR